jgi:hypothetical protein
VSALTQIEQAIERLLAAQPYGLAPEERHREMLSVLREEIAYACDANAGFRNYVRHWPVNFREAEYIAELPFLPVGIFKRDPPLSLVAPSEIRRTLHSSSTTGQIPSSVVLDAATSRRMTKGVIRIIRDYIGPARRPYLVIDTPENLAAGEELTARGAAVQSLESFATTTVCCLRDDRGNARLDLGKLLACAEEWKDAGVLVYGFTYVIWTEFAQVLKREGVRLNLPNVHVLHSGGWKRLQEQAVTKEAFSREVAAVFGCAPERVIDYYGMVENVGVVYPDCEFGNKHVPAFGEVIVRDPLTLAPVRAGQQGLVQICSVLPASFPGFLVLTDDIAEIVGYDGCGCGRRGTHFRFMRRAPKVETRGCGNLQTARYQPEMEPTVHG